MTRSITSLSLPIIIDLLSNDNITVSLEYPVAWVPSVHSMHPEAQRAREDPAALLATEDTATW